MKKIVLSLAGVLAATAFAPEAAAVPAFARQTGMACTACHQQHFPVLNSFGRAFKAGGYTMMGAQGKVEGDHLSLPDTLNMSMLLKTIYRDQGGNPGAAFNLGNGAGTDSSNGQWRFGNELVLLAGGRVSENAGALTEITVHATNASGSGTDLIGFFRMPFVYDVGSVKLSVVPFTAQDAGPFVGYELSSGATLRANRWSEQRGDISAVQYTLNAGANDVTNTMAGGAATGSSRGAATGFAFVAQNDTGYIAYTRFTPNAMTGTSTTSTDMGSNYFRAALTPSYNDWAFHLGAGLMTGESEVLGRGTVTVVNSAMYDARAHFFDGQAQGKLGGKDISFYASYAKAPVVGGTCGVAATTGVIASSGCNLYNIGTHDKWSWALGVDYSIIPHTLHLGAAYRDARIGRLINGGNGTDKSTMIQAIYDLSQNVALHAVYSSRSGSKYGIAAGQTTTGENESLFMLEASW